MTRILVISSLFSGAKDEYSCQICLGMKVTQTSYVVVLDAINQWLASHTRTRNIRWQNKTCLFYENSGKKRQITQILQHQFTDFVSKSNYQVFYMVNIIQCVNVW